MNAHHTHIAETGLILARTYGYRDGAEVTADGSMGNDYAWDQVEDTDPRAVALLDRYRAAWHNAARRSRAQQQEINQLRANIARLHAIADEFDDKATKPAMPAQVRHHLALARAFQAAADIADGHTVDLDTTQAVTA